MHTVYSGFAYHEYHELFMSIFLRPRALNTANCKPLELTSLHILHPNLDIHTYLWILYLDTVCEQNLTVF